MLELHKQLEEHMAGPLIDGSEAIEINDGNDGACVFFFLTLLCITYSSSLGELFCFILGELISTGNRYGDEDNLISPWLHFQGLGIGPSIPLYLRVNGNVCNLNFSKKECEIYVNDIWVAKAEFEENLRLKNTPTDEEEDDDASQENIRSNKIHLSDFFKIFLEVNSLLIVFTCLVFVILNICDDFSVLCCSIS
jgi:hypothetical protein